MRTLVTFLVGLAIGGVAVALLYTYPKGEVREKTYCVACGAVLYRSHTNPVLGGEHGSGEADGALAVLMGANAEHHEHRWAQPMAYVSPTHPTLSPAQQLDNDLVSSRLDTIAWIEGSPDAIATLREALRNDPVRARAFVARLLDTKAPMPTDAILALLGGDRPWAEKWADVDAFSAAYRCDVTSTRVRCHVPIAGKDETALEWAPPTRTFSGVVQEWRASRSGSR